MSPVLLDIAVAGILILGISQFRSPRAARYGNLTAAVALLWALVIVLVRHRPGPLLVIAVAAGTGILTGWLLASRVQMIQLPAMVAFQHGIGGVAAFLVSFAELTRTAGGSLPPLAKTSALLGLVIGAGTFSGSMVASGKLAGRLRQTPVILPVHNVILAGLAAAVLLLATAAGSVSALHLVRVLAMLLVSLSVAVGIVFSIRIGGADMPVVISFLNATAGLAAAFCGLTIGSRLLTICGATVAASGWVLTHVMCRAMNRSLANIFSGRRQQGPSAAMTTMADEPASATSSDARIDVSPAPPAAVEPANPFARALAIAKAARRVIIVPGYGMALADAQEEVSRFADRLVGMGKEVVFAIHPVAGRMPGHMHVLLAEAEVDYGMIRELKDVNPEFARADLALIVGACDVVNPAAIERADTPISGMPILRAYEAKGVVVCNLDERPGYSGVENPLYRDPKTILLLGNAKTTVGRLVRELG